MTQGTVTLFIHKVDAWAIYCTHDANLVVGFGGALQRCRMRKKNLNITSQVSVNLLRFFFGP